MSDSAVSDLLNRAEEAVATERWSEADTLLEQLATRVPHDNRLLYLLGFSAARRGDWNQALVHYRQIEAVAGEEEGFQVELGEVYEHLGDVDRARRCYDQALQLNPDNVSALCHQALLYALNRELEKGAPLLSRAYDLAPESPQVLASLGQAYTQGMSYEKAVDYLQRAIDKAPQSVQYYELLVDLFSRIRDWERAILTGEAAIRAVPDSARMLIRLGSLYHESGAREKGLVVARRAQGINPKLPGALQLLVEWNEEGIESEISRVKEWLADENTPGMTNDARSQFCYLVGSYEHKRKHFDNAFKYFTEGGKLMGAGFDPKTFQQLAHQSEALFTKDFFRRRCSLEQHSPTPVFIVGMPRSGTTLVESILLSHSVVDSVGEGDFIEGISAGVGGMVTPPGDYPDVLGTLPEAAVKYLADHYQSCLEESGVRGEVVVDKMPHNINHLGLIALLFPQARIILCRRNPLDVATSCYSIKFGGNQGWSYDLEDIAWYSKHVDRMMALWKSVLPMEVYEVQYETLVNDPEGVSRELVAYCGLEWERACLDFYKSSRVVHTASNQQVKQPIYRSSVGRWRDYEAYMGPMMAAYPEWADE